MQNQSSASVWSASYQSKLHHRYFGYGADNESIITRCQNIICVVRILSTIIWHNHKMWKTCCCCCCFCCCGCCFCCCCCSSSSSSPSSSSYKHHCNHIFPHKTKQLRAIEIATHSKTPTSYYERSTEDKLSSSSFLLLWIKVDYAPVGGGVFSSCCQSL